VGVGPCISCTATIGSCRWHWGTQQASAANASVKCSVTRTLEPQRECKGGGAPPPYLFGKNLRLQLVEMQILAFKMRFSEKLLLQVASEMLFVQ